MDEYSKEIRLEYANISWGLVFGLGVILQNTAVAARRDTDRLRPCLEDATLAALESLLTLHGPLILASAEGRELQAQADQLQMTQREQMRFRAEAEVLAADSADPVAVTEAEPISEGELLLQEAGRDLRPDTITPAPDITSTGAAMIEAAEKVGEGEPPIEESEGISPRADFASEASAPEIQTSSAPVPPLSSEAATNESASEEKHTDASKDNAAQ